jgi:hypothetical protein
VELSSNERREQRLAAVEAAQIFQHVFHDGTSVRQDGQERARRVAGREAMYGGTGHVAQILSPRHPIG